MLSFPCLALGTPKKAGVGGYLAILLCREGEEGWGRGGLRPRKSLCTFNRPPFSGPLNKFHFSPEEKFSDLVGRWVGMTPGCVAVRSWRCLLASRRAPLPFYWLGGGGLIKVSEVKV